MLGCIAYIMLFVSVLTPAQTRFCDREWQFQAALNGTRAEYGIPVLQGTWGLNQAAETRVDEVAATCIQFSEACHYRPDGSKFDTVLAGLDWSVACEIIGEASDLDSVMTAFMHSPSHAGCIVGDYTEVGVGIDGNYYVAEFTR